MDSKFSLSAISIWFIAIVCSAVVLFPSVFKRKPNILNNDVHYYYGYLPAIVIEQDPQLQFVYHPNVQYSRNYWFLNSPNGGHVFKMTMGMSFLYSPFFLMGHVTAKILDYPADGFSKPYLFFLALSGLFYLLCALFLLRKILLLYFDDWVIAATLLIVGLGSNLFYYSVHEAAMPHVANFFLFTSIIYLTIKWHKNASWNTSILLGLAIGLVTLIRPSNALIGLIPLLYSVHDKDSRNAKIQYVRTHLSRVLIAGLCILFIWIPQLIYWKALTGDWFYYSYGESESFFFQHPRVLETLFSFRKGLFIYTPLMALSCVGLFFLRKRLFDFKWAIWVFTILNIYIVSSWWCWWYGGSFGLRAYIDMYALWAFPLAVLMEKILAFKNTIRYSFLSLISLFILLNLFQSVQYWRGALHWDGMNYTLYKSQFLNMNGVSPSTVEAPNYELAKQGKESYEWFRDSSK